MPDLIIKPADFQQFSDATKVELWEFMRGAFDQSRAATDRNRDVYESEKTQKIFRKEFEHRLEDARKGAFNNYRYYLDAIDGLNNKLGQIIPIDTPIRFQVVSIEVAIAVILGLSADSRKVISALLVNSKLSRDHLADVLGGAQKINGTVGSINRRLAKRFCTQLYSKKNIDEVKLIEFDGEYRFACDIRALQLAMQIIDSGIDASKENLIVEFQDDTRTSVLKIEALAVQLALNGMAYVEDWSWDYSYDGLVHEDRSFSVSVVRTVSSATLALVTLDGEEWEIDRIPYGSRLKGHPGNFSAPPLIKIDDRPHSYFWKD